MYDLHAAAAAGAFFGSIAPRLQPRFYSISSAPAAHPGAVHITCAVVCDTTPSGRAHEGIASFFLKRAAIGTTRSGSPSPCNMWLLLSGEFAITQLHIRSISISPCSAGPVAVSMLLAFTH